MIDSTEPICTPRNFTGAPTLRPLSVPVKKQTKRSGRENHWPEPRISTSATSIAIPPSTKRPTVDGFVRLGISLPRCFALPTTCQELLYLGIRRMGQQIPGIARCDHGAVLGVEKDRIVSNRENAGQFMRHNHDRGSQTFPQ